MADEEFASEEDANMQQMRLFDECGGGEAASLSAFRCGNRLINDRTEASNKSTLRC